MNEEGQGSGCKEAAGSDVPHDRSEFDSRSLTRPLTLAGVESGSTIAARR